MKSEVLLQQLRTMTHRGHRKKRKNLKTGCSFKVTETEHREGDLQGLGGMETEIVEEADVGVWLKGFCGGN